MDIESKEVTGVKVGGRTPKALLLNDGTRLALEDADNPRGESRWTRVGDDDRSEALSVAEAAELAGDRHTDYVAVRTRAEVEWLHIVAEWYREQADRLAIDLAGAYR
ncbi:MAG: hypothetical protein ACXWDQ_05920 [Solirubrobacterales bacterium]